LIAEAEEFEEVVGSVGERVGLGVGRKVGVVAGGSVSDEALAVTNCIALLLKRCGI